MKLSDWHTHQKSFPRRISDTHIGRRDITVITYIYGTTQYVSAHFYQIENALRETWFHFGLLKTVIVTNVITSEINHFADLFSGWIRLDICNNLIPGDLYHYSRDCIENLHERFSTPYMLFVHPDGFPLRPGIDDFIGTYDYIGAPWTQPDDLWGRLFLSRHNRVGNGGFSLRTHEICEAASILYKKRWHIIPNIFLLYEDYFFCRFLPKFDPSYRRQFQFAPLETAKKFALEHFDNMPSSTPLGFHSAEAFERLTGQPASIP